MRPEDLLRPEIRFHGTPRRTAKDNVFMVKVYDITKPHKRMTVSTRTYTMKAARAWIHERKREQAKANGFQVPGEAAPAAPQGEASGAPGAAAEGSHAPLHPRLERFLSARENETERFELAAKLTFADAYHSYIGDKAGKVSERQIWNFDALAKRYWLPLFGSTRLCDLKTDRFRKYLGDRVTGTLGGRRLKNVSINNEKQKLSMLFRWCRLNGYMLNDPLAGISRYPEERSRPRVLDENEQRAILKACQEVQVREVEGLRPGSLDPSTAPWSVWTQRWTPPRRLYPLVLVAIESGLRRGTLCGLEWGHLDLDDGWFNVPARLMKYREDFRAPMSTRALETLREWRSRLLKTKGVKAVQPTATVFGLTQWSQVFKAFKTAKVKAGIPTVRFHDLRRTFITNARRRGVAMETTMALSDHRDLRTVLKHYRVISDDELLRGVGRDPGAEESKGAGGA